MGGSSGNLNKSRNRSERIIQFINVQLEKCVLQEKFTSCNEVGVYVWAKDTFHDECDPGRIGVNSSGVAQSISGRKLNFYRSTGA